MTNQDRAEQRLSGLLRKRGISDFMSLLRNQRPDQRQYVRGLRSLVEKPVGAEPEAKLLVLGIRVVGQHRLDRARQKMPLLQRLQHIETASGFQSDIDQDQIRLQHRQIGYGCPGIGAVTDQLCAGRFDRRCEQSSNDR